MYQCMCINNHRIKYIFRKTSAAGVLYYHCNGMHLKLVCMDKKCNNIFPKVYSIN